MSALDTHLDSVQTGLASEGERTDPARRMIGRDETPIDFLAPRTSQHEYVLGYLLKRLRYSEQVMTQFHPRWAANELKMQAYVGLADYGALVQNIRDTKKSPEMVEITVPYTWSTISTIVTYLLHMFGGRTPIFQTKTSKGEFVKKAANMELLLQYNSDYVKFLRALYFFLMDGETYGVGIMRTMWRKDQKVREIIVPPSPELVELMTGMGSAPTPQRERQSYTSFEGSSVANIDPYMFFPDPRVPMHEVNEKGEFVFWRAYEGRHMLLREQAAGRLRWVNEAGDSLPVERGEDAGQSMRSLRALGQSHPGSGFLIGRESISSNFQVDQGTVEIIPRELGLGEGKVPEKWLFTILNKRQIVQAQPLNLNHGKHPIVVAEPNAVGYAFGQLGTADMLGPFQDLQSWFLNSHIYNVRAALNNMLVVDPTKVELQDLKKPRPGGLIRLKNTAFGSVKPTDAVHQLAVADVTQSHVGDMQTLNRLASDMTGATDNNRGLQDAGGRKTATEVRTSADAGASRLAAKGKIYSSMALTDLAGQQSSNFQQNLSQEYEFQVLGENSVDTVRISPEDIMGDFFFPIHDGTLPMDKVGLLQVWQQIFQTMLADPGTPGNPMTGQGGRPPLGAQYDLGKIFAWIAQLGGAQNLQNFKIQVAPQGQIDQQVQAGNMVPLGDLGGPVV